MTTERGVSFTTEDGVRLEGLLALAPGARDACVVCHPHPLYGGDMHSSVVVAVIRALGEAGVSTLRFQFRGVGGSGGRHGGGVAETADVRAAVAFVRAESGAARVAVAGYSFGAMVALSTARTAAPGTLAAACAVAPPLAMVELAFAADLAIPVLLVAGDRDEYCPLRDFEALAAKLGASSSSVVLAGTDHFFGGVEREAGRAIAGFVTAAGTTMQRHVRV